MNKWLKSLIRIGAAAVLFDAFLLERLLFEVRHFYIGNKIEDRPIRIIQLSDLHLRNTVGITYKKLIGRIKKLHPDILFITGDAIDKTGNAETLEKFLRLIPSEIQKVAILGNHEHESATSNAAIAEAYHRTNTQLLINESHNISLRGATITVTGLDDINYSTSDFQKAVTGLSGTPKHHFVLAHSPAQYDEILEFISSTNSGIKPYLCLAGHNHGGQIRLGNITPVLPANHGNYLNGWFGDKPPYLYVSKGFGNSTIQVRFWSRSEITVFDYFI